MRVLLVLFVMIFGSTDAFAAGAGGSIVRWWQALDVGERMSIQGDLILVGFYDALVDGEFGPATERALIGYQRKIGNSRGGGVLSELEIERLKSDAGKRYGELGMEVVEDPGGTHGVIIPRGLLSEMKVEDGLRTYSTRDGLMHFFIATMEDGPADLSSVAATLSQPKAGRKIVYQSLSTKRFVLSTIEDGVTSYTNVAIHEDRLLAFSVLWASDYAELGRLTAIFAASYSGPIAYFGEGEEETESGPAEMGTPSRPPGQSFGSFYLPDELPKTIVFSGTISAGTALDFRRALRARPEADTLWLSSEGGSVNEGLLLAHQVADHDLTTVVPDGAGCYSACAYVFFAGDSRQAIGELGVHQIYGDGVSASDAQVVLSDVLDALHEFGVPQEVVSAMLRARPNEMHVFSASELAMIEKSAGTATSNTVPAARPSVLFLSSPSETEARAAAIRYGVVYRAALLGLKPVVEATDLAKFGIWYRVIVYPPSREAAEKVCLGVKATGGDCIVGGG